MDKKRRVTMSQEVTLSDTLIHRSWLSKLKLTTKKEKCGIYSFTYEFMDTVGTGSYTFHHFDGLFISICEVVLKKDLMLSGDFDKETLELSFLIEGEQIISIDNLSNKLIYENQESYIVYFTKIKGSVFYPKSKKLKEIKIRIHRDFIYKHHLEKEYDLLKKYSLKANAKKIVQPFCPKTQEIISEILSDQRDGLLKRLFLESKVLELIILKLDTSPAPKTVSSPLDHMVKKMYEAQHIICTDLSNQYTIQDISKQIGVNDFILKKEFKRVFGKTIYEFAIEERMQKAKKLLEYSQKPIYEISEIVGYKNATHFTAAFKKQEGTTPKKFRISKNIL